MSVPRSPGLLQSANSCAVATFPGSEYGCTLVTEACRDRATHFYTVTASAASTHVDCLWFSTKNTAAGDIAAGALQADIHTVYPERVNQYGIAWRLFVLIRPDLGDYITENRGVSTPNRTADPERTWLWPYEIFTRVAIAPAVVATSTVWKHRDILQGHQPLALPSGK